MTSTLSVQAVWHRRGFGPPVPGELRASGGGVAFVPVAGQTGFAVEAGELSRIGPVPGPPGPDARERLLIASSAGDGDARHTVRLDAEDGRRVLAALETQRREAGLPAVPLAGAGGALPPPPGDPSAGPGWPGPPS